MLNRRKFLASSLLASAAWMIRKNFHTGQQTAAIKPVVISTWAPNAKANEAAWEWLKKNGRALDAIENGIHVAEADPSDQSVGYGGLPDREGKVTLDACIMDEYGNCGSVMFLEHILHPISVARKVMEKTPHVQLAGEGALKFALANGFKKTNLLTPAALKAYAEWKKQAAYDARETIDVLEKQNKTRGQIDNHDTIGMLALDEKGNLSGGCSTSGMAFKMRGRIGDSPIIGAGLFVDNEVGAATATGVGEEVVRICGSHTVVELMRQGLSPTEACKKTVERILHKRGDKAKGMQVGFIAVNTNGEFGAYALQKGFSYAVRTQDGSKVYESESIG